MLIRVYGQISNYDKNSIIPTIGLQTILLTNLAPLLRILGSTTVHNHLYWKTSKDGWFHTSATYELITKQQEITNYPYEWIWKLDTRPKIKNFMWKLLNNGLPIKARLQKNRAIVPTCCTFYNHSLEDSEHLFLTCPFTTNMINQIKQNIAGLISMVHTQRWVVHTQDMNIKETTQRLKLALTHEELVMLSTNWWCLWHFRNQSIFSTTPETNIKDHSHYIIKQITYWEKTKKLDHEEDYIGKHNINNPRKKKNIAWKKPSPGYHKINFDVVNDNEETSLGFVIRNDQGHPIKMHAEKYGSNSILITETIALKKSITMAKQLGFSHLEIEGDNLSVINVVNGVWSCPWKIEIIGADIMMDLLHFSSVRIQHIFREINSVADRLSKLAFSSLGLDWLEDRDLRLLVRKDVLGWRHNRH